MKGLAGLRPKRIGFIALIGMAAGWIANAEYEHGRDDAAAVDDDETSSATYWRGWHDAWDAINRAGGICLHDRS